MAAAVSNLDQRIGRLASCVMSSFIEQSKSLLIFFSEFALIDRSIVTNLPKVRTLKNSKLEHHRTTAGQGARKIN